jgi:pyridoxine 4-dehydrogenase
MIQRTDLGDSLTLPGTSIAVNRMGYGLPRDVRGAIAVLREAVASGVNHIGTADFYGPHVTGIYLISGKSRDHNVAAWFASIES